MRSAGSEVRYSARDRIKMSVARYRAGSRKRKDNIFRFATFFAAGIGVLLLLLVIYRIIADGTARLSLDFVVRNLSSRPLRTGIWPAIVGSFYVMSLTAVIAVPLGVAAAVYLEEFTATKTRFTNFIQLNIANLSGVPSIVYGLLGLAVFVRWGMIGPTILAGALTMSLLILPMIIIVTQEALRAVPQSYREASIGLGSTQWQAIRRQVLPHATPGILTGIILALSRAIGETAPLIVVGATASAFFTPKNVTDKYTVLPLQIFNWAMQPEEEFHRASAAAILVLMAGLLMMNSFAIYFRNRSLSKRN